MGEFSAGKWVIMIAIFFIGFALLITFTINAKQQIYGYQDRSVSYSDISFLNKSGYNFMSSFCAGESSYMTRTFLGLGEYVIQCSDFNITNDTLCDAIPGCGWNSLFSRCGGYMSSSTSPELNFSTKSALCNSQTVNNIHNCSFFGCAWISNAQELAEFNTKDLNDFSVTDIFYTIGDVITFRADIGLGQFNFIISIIFYIIILALGIALYFMLPFLH